MIFGASNGIQISRTKREVEKGTNSYLSTFCRIVD